MQSIEDLLREELEARHRERAVQKSMDHVWNETWDAMRWPVTIVGILGILAVLVIVVFVLGPFTP